MYRKHTYRGLNGNYLRRAILNIFVILGKYALVTIKPLIFNTNYEIVYNKYSRKIESEFIYFKKEKYLKNKIYLYILILYGNKIVITFKDSHIPKDDIKKIS